MILAILAQLAPALLLLALLLVGRYPGERVLVRYAARRAPALRRAPGRLPRRRPRRSWVPAGALLGRHMAVRPPPVLPGVC